MKKKFYVEGQDFAVSRVFSGPYGMDQVNKIEEADLLVLTGGGDISADLYNEKHHVTMYGVNNKRDAEEVEAYYKAVNHRVPVFGICRGAQLIHALNGGKLWQNVDGHRGTPHEVLDCVDNTITFVTSLHHQMMLVDDKAKNDFEIVALAAESSYREIGNHKIRCTNKANVFLDDIEVLWYPKVQALCYQAHPEYGLTSDIDFAGKLMKRYGILDGGEPVFQHDPKRPTPGEVAALVRKEHKYEDYYDLWPEWAA